MINTSRTSLDYRPDQLREWTSTLARIGADLSPLDSVVATIGRANRLNDEARSIVQRRESAPSAVAAEVAALVSGTDATETREDLSRKLEATQIAAAQVMAQAWTKLSARGDANLDILRPLHDAATAELAELWPLFASGAAYTATDRSAIASPVRARELEEAVRLGLATEWLRAEELNGLIATIRTIHWQWVIDGIVSNRGTRKGDVASAYLPNEFYYLDLYAIGQLDPRVRYGKFGEALRLYVGGSALRTIAEVDAALPAKSLEPSPTGATWDGAELARHNSWTAEQRSKLTNAFQ